MNLERLLNHMGMLLSKHSAKEVLFVGNDVPKKLTVSGRKFILGQADEYGALINKGFFDAAVIIGKISGFDPFLLFEQLRKMVRGLVVIFVESNLIGDARNIAWSSDGIKFGVEALKDMLDAVGFKKMEINKTGDFIIVYAWAHEPIRIFNAVSQKARILSADIKSEAGLGTVEIGKPFEIETDVELATKQEAFLRIIVDNCNKRLVADSPRFSGSQKIVARCTGESIKPECTIKLELWCKSEANWEFASCTNYISLDVVGFEQKGEALASDWAFLKRLSLEHYEQLTPMACYPSGGAIRLVCEFEGKKPEALGLLIRLFDKDGFILNQTAIPNPKIRKEENDFEFICDCSYIPLASGIYKLGVLPISYNSSVVTSSHEEKEVWFEVRSEEEKNNEVVYAKFALDKLELVEQKRVAKPSIISVHSPARKVYWIMAEPKSPIWWETTFDWTGNAELNMRFQLILPTRWTVLLDRNTRDTGLKIDLPSGRWRAIFSISGLFIQGTVLLGKVDLEKDGEIADSRHFWLALPKSDVTQEGIVLMPWEGTSKQTCLLKSENVKVEESASDKVYISIEMGEKTFVELSAIKGFEKSALEVSPFDKLARFELPKRYSTKDKYFVASLKPFGWSRNSTRVVGFSLSDTTSVEEPLQVEWMLFNPFHFTNEG